MPATPSERSLAGKIGAYEKWSRTADRTAATAPARRALWQKFETEVDPDGILAAEERARRTELAWKAHFARLSLKSAKARRKAVELTAQAVAAEEQITALGGSDVDVA